MDAIGSLLIISELLLWALGLCPVAAFPSFDALFSGKFGNNEEACGTSLEKGLIFFQVNKSTANATVANRERMMMAAQYCKITVLSSPMPVSSSYVEDLDAGYIINGSFLIVFFSPFCSSSLATNKAKCLGIYYVTKEDFPKKNLVARDKDLNLF